MGDMRVLSCLALVATLCGLGTTACGDGSASPEPSASTHTYTVEGTVVQRMDPRVGRELVIQHEAIVGFIDQEGERTLMPPMSMSFPVAERVSMSDLEPGTRVRFTLEVDWEGSPPYQITTIERLP